MDQSNISHIVNSFWWEGNVLKGFVEAANTQRGNDFDGLVRQGCKVGFSLRAVGPITERHGDTVTVKSPLTIFSYDWVIHPSHAAAYMDSVINESYSPIIANLCESFSPIFEPIYEDVTNYFIESSRNLSIIAESMGINMDEKIVGSEILVTEDARSIIIRDGYDTVVVNPEQYLTNEITSYMSKLDLKSESSNIEYFDMHSDDYDEELNEGFFDGFRRIRLRQLEGKLAVALDERKEMDRKYKNRDTVRVMEPIHTSTSSYDLTPGSSVNRTYSTEYKYVYKSVRDVKADKDDEIDDLKKEIKELKRQLGESSLPLQESNGSNYMEEAKRLSVLAMSKFTRPLSLAKRSDEVFNDSICRDMSKGNNVRVQLFALGCQSLELPRDVDYNAYINHRIVPDLKEIVNKIKMETNYNVELKYDEDTFRVIMTGSKLSENDDLLDEGIRELGSKIKEKFSKNKDKLDDEPLVFGDKDADDIDFDKLKNDKEYANKMVTHIEKPDNSTKNGESKKGVLDNVKEKAGEALTKTREFAGTTRGKVTLGALGLGAVAGGAYLLNKRKYKQKKDKKAKNLKECMIDYEINEYGELLVEQMDMDFLLELCEYELSESEIMDTIEDVLISEGLFSSIKKAVSGSGKAVGEFREKRTGKKVQKLGKRLVKAQQSGNEKKVAKLQGKLSQKQEKLDSITNKLDEKYNRKPISSNPVPKDGIISKLGKFAGTTKGKIALGTIAGGAALAGGAYLLKKRKEKQEKDEKAKNLRECMIDYEINEYGELLVEQMDMEFLLEAFDYEVSESELLEAIEYEIISESDEIDSLMQKQKELTKKLSKIIYSGTDEEISNMEKQLKDVQGKIDKLMDEKEANMRQANRDKIEKALAKTEEMNRKREEEERNRERNREDNSGSAVKQVSGNFMQKHGKKLLVGGLVGGGLLAGGIIAANALKKRKEKQKKDKEAKNLKECMIDIYFEDSGSFYILEEDMDFLLEACGYEVSESEILEAIEYELMNEYDDNTNF